jgi:hypothetical protein
MNDSAPIRLTDELEREFVLQAIEEQFRPHPLRALIAWVRKLIHTEHQVAGKAAHA